MWIVSAFVIVLVAVAFLVVYSRRRSIIDVGGRNRYFASLAKRFGFEPATDGYFLQLTGEWKHHPVLIHPHNFEGPGSITLIYADSGVPFREHTWIEPTCSLGRAVTDWKRGTQFGFEFAGDPFMQQKAVRETMAEAGKHYPFVAITLPARLIFSPLAGQWLEKRAHFVILLALDAGRKPADAEIRTALDTAAEIAKVLRNVDA